MPSRAPATRSTSTPAKWTNWRKLLDEGLKDYAFNPVTTSADARVVNFPMPGGAIGPNVQMMAETRILNRYGEVLAEFPEVVRAGGAWTSVTPGSQQYWLQAFNNVLHGRWKKIDPGYGRSVLGYFGRTPEPPDPEVIRIAAEQLKLEPFAGDPLEKAPDSIAMAEEALRERNLPLTEENIFLVASAIVPGKNMELNEGIRLLTGRAKFNLPLKAKDKPAEAAPAPAPVVAAPAFTAPVTTRCTVVEGGVTPHLPRHHRTPGRPEFTSRARADRHRRARRRACSRSGQRRPAHAGVLAVRGQGGTGRNQREGGHPGAKGPGGGGSRGHEGQGTTCARPAMVRWWKSTPTSAARSPPTNLF